MSGQTIATVDYCALIARLPADSTLILHYVSWDEYEELLKAVGEAPSLRMSYAQGVLQIMLLSTRHEKYARLIEALVMLLSMRRRIKVLSFGSATIKKQAQEKAAEPDACFYVQNASRIGSKEELDFSSDPPPDIVVEVDLHHDSLTKFSMYATLGVSEIWRYDGQTVSIYHLQGSQYIPVEASLALPMLTSQILTAFLTCSQHEDQYDTLLAFEDSVVENDTKGMSPLI